MSPLAALLPPIALLLSVAGAGEGAQGVGARQSQPGEDPPARVAPDRAQPDFEARLPIFVSRDYLPFPARQVRIEQSITIRISPRASAPAPAPPMRPNMFVGVPDRGGAANFVERRMGKCLPVRSIAGVQSGGGSNLILYLQDRRVVRAELERSCRARDFYSGFYLSRSSDGRLCVERDMLQSRSGASCKLTQMRQLVEVDD